jgi:hypothetical protein
MGFLIKHSRGTRIAITPVVKCRALNVSSILSSNSWEGKRCLLIGGGTSLDKFNFELIKNELTIGVNKSFIKFPTTINYGMDTGLYNKVMDIHSKSHRTKFLAKMWKQYTGIKVFIYRPKNKFDPSIFVVNDTASTKLSFDLEKGIPGGNNSGFGALALAICLGATKIGLLGYDFLVDKKHRHTHWHDGYEGQDFDTMQAKLDKFKLPFINFAEEIKEKNISVINLNENSALNCFPKTSLENFLKD